MNLRDLTPTAKAQAWGMAVGGATAFLVAYNLQLALAIFVVGWAGAWALGEWLLAPMLIGKDDIRAIAIAVTSGAAFPWIGTGLAALAQALRP